jgi:hypothetical protein
MIKDDHVMLFDTKYKKMSMKGKSSGDSGDLDRNDFFQINTYMSYYQNHQNMYKVKVGGLLYPMDRFEKEKCHSETWFDNSDTNYIVDGIDLSGDIEPKNEEAKFSRIVEREKTFLSNIKNFES